MENVVSARRLRKSMLYDLPDFNNSVESDENKRLGIIDKFLIKSLISCILLFTIIYIVGKYGNILKENRYIMRVYEH